MFPAMFITPDTVPEYLPPTCIGTDHDGQMVHSRKNSTAVKQPIAVYALLVIAAGMIDMAQPNKPTIATERCASLELPVLTSSQSVATPPNVSPTTPAHSGSDAKMPTLISVRWRASTR